jgi:hypothetical protein
MPNARKRGQGGKTPNVDSSSSSPGHKVDFDVAPLILSSSPYCLTARQLLLVYEDVGNLDLISSTLGDQHECRVCSQWDFDRPMPEDGELMIASANG